MVADQRRSEHVCSAARRISSSLANSSAINESSQLLVMPSFADPGEANSYPNAALPACASSFHQSILCRTHTDIGTRAPKLVFFGASAESGTDLDSSQSTPSSSEGSDCSNGSHSYSRNKDGCDLASSKRSGNCVSTVRIPVVAVDNEIRSMALQGGKVYSSKLRSRAQELNKKLHPPNSSSTELESPQEAQKDLEKAAGEVNQREPEEEGCKTPTGRDQCIPRYGWEVSVLLCPPAPKKKRRRLFYSVGKTGRAANNFGSHVGANRE